MKIIITRQYGAVVETAVEVVVPDDIADEDAAMDWARAHRDEIGEKADVEIGEAMFGLPREIYTAEVVEEVPDEVFPESFDFFTEDGFTQMLAEREREENEHG